MATYRHVVEVEARFIDNLTDKADGASRSISEVGDAARKAGREVDKLGRKNADPDVDIDTSKFRSGMDKVDRLLNKFKKVHTAALNLKESNTYQRIKKITDSMEGLTRKTWQIGVSILDKATAPIRAIKNALFSVQSIVAAITAGFAAQKLVISPIGVADAYSGALSGFKNLLGDTAGQKMMDDLDAFALKTPFKTSGVIDNAQKMMAMGWDSENLIEDMEIIGDAAAATGKLDQGLESIVRALAQIKTKGKLSTEELNQLAEAGIAAKPILAETLGYGTGDEGLAALAADLEDGAIGSEKAIEALLTGMQKYKGMMDAMANEQASGLKDQIVDAFEVSVVRRWGQGLQDGAKRGLGKVVELLDTARGALDEFGEMLYDIGKNASNWVADRFENMISRVLEITDSFEFKNASLKDKVSMLWNGVIVDPLKEWWEDGGRDKTIDTAGKIGKWMGETLTKGLLGIFGITDMFKDTDEELGTAAEIAKSFSDAFRENFDASAVTDKLVEAVSNVWNALPAWAKVALGVYGGAKVATWGMNAVSGIANFIGTSGTTVGGNVTGASGLLGMIGKTGQYGIGGAGILGGLSKLGYGVTGLFGTAGKAATLGMTGGTAAGVGAGAIAMGAGALHIGKSTYDSIKAYKSGDEITGKAEAARAIGTGTGMAAGVGIGIAGAKVGAALGTLAGPLGTIAGALIGGGVGTVVGWVAGDKIARNIEAARYESETMKEVIKDTEASSEEIAAAWEKAKWENAAKHFGDIKLSMEEIAALSDKIVWGDDLTNYESFTMATKTAQTNLESLKSAAEDTKKWMWKAGLGVKFTDDEEEAIIASFDEYITSAKSYLENKHYEFTTSAAVLIDIESDAGKALIESGNAFYASQQQKLESLGAELGYEIGMALGDNIIIPDEQKVITNLQQQIAEITEKISNAESQAEIELIKVKFGGGNLDSDSFENFMTQTTATLEERVSASDEAFTIQVSNLAMQLADGAITQDEYDSQLKTLTDGYEAKIESIKATVMDLELDMISDAYADKLGEDVKEDLTNALNNAINSDKPIASIDDETMAKWLGIDNIEANAETIDNIRDWLGQIIEQLEIGDIDTDLTVNVGKVETEGDVAGKVKAAVDGATPEEVRAETIKMLLTGDAEVISQLDTSNLAAEFGLSPEYVQAVLWQLLGEKTILEKVDILAKEFGIEPSESATVLWNLTGSKGTITKVGVTASDFGVAGPFRFSPTVSITPKAQITPIKYSASWLLSQQNSSGEGGNYRGGFVGGSSALEGFADGGFVSGGARLIKVAEEGTPEAIIPLGSHRRKRGLELWEKTGEMLGVAGFANGGFTRGNRDEGIRFHSYGGGESDVSTSVRVEIGGVNVNVQVDARGAENVAEVIKAQSGEIAETVAGILADELGGQFSNTPRRAS